MLARCSFHTNCTVQVTEIFEPLKTDRKPRLNYSNLPPPIKPEVFHQMVTIEPVKDKHELEITWLLPDMFSTYKKKPLSYLSELMGQCNEHHTHAYTCTRSSHASTHSSGGF